MTTSFVLYTMLSMSMAIETNRNFIPLAFDERFPIATYPVDFDLVRSNVRISTSLPSLSHVQSGVRDGSCGVGLPRAWPLHMRPYIRSLRHQLLLRQWAPTWLFFKNFFHCALSTLFLYYHDSKRCRSLSDLILQPAIVRQPKLHCSPPAFRRDRKWLTFVNVSTAISSKLMPGENSPTQLLRTYCAWRKSTVWLRDNIVNGHHELKRYRTDPKTGDYFTDPGVITAAIFNEQRARLPYSFQNAALLTSSASSAVYKVKLMDMSLNELMMGVVWVGGKPDPGGADQWFRPRVYTARMDDASEGGRDIRLWGWKFRQVPRRTRKQMLSPIRGLTNTMSQTFRLLEFHNAA